MKNNSIWLTGSRGFIGSYVKKRLIESGYNVKFLSNDCAGEEDLIEVDFSKPDQISNALSKFGAPSAVVHLGWGNTDDPHHDNHIKLNVDNSINLIDGMYSAGVQKIIFMGSSSEYGGLVGALKEDEILPEKLNNYIEGKRTVGKYGLDVAKKLNRDFINIRLFYTYGAGQKENSLINQIYNCSLGNEDMNLSPCEHYRDYIHVSDVAIGIEKFLDVDGTHIVNLGSGTVIQLRNFVEKLWKSLGVDSARLIFGAHEQPATEQSQPKSYADLRKLKKLTGWTPPLSIEEGIKKTIDALRNINLQK